MRKYIFQIALMMLALTVRAANFKTDGICYMETSSNTVKVLPNGSSSGSGSGFGLSSGYEGDIVIPSTVTYNGVEYSVTAVEEESFSYSIKLTSVSIPATVTDLGSEPFASCGKLTAITVAPDNQIYRSIDGVLYDKNVTTIIACPGARAGEFAVPETVRTVASSAFYGCSKLTSVTLPASVSEIGERAFKSCTYLESVNIPNGITEIKDHLFYGCASLMSVNIPNGVVRIGENAFYYCKKLTDIPLPSSLKTIGDNAFEQCSSLLNLTIPEGVTSIGDCAMMGCNKLKKLSMPASLNQLGTGVFKQCLALQTIDLAEGNTTFSVENGMLFDADKTSLICCPAGLKGEFVIPSSVTVIEDYAFYYCKNLTKIRMPENLVAIREGAFVFCSSLKTIVFSQNVRRIGTNAFASCSDIKEVVCMAKTPTMLAEEIFSASTYNTATLYVLALSKEQYEAADYWKKFNKVRSIGDVNQDQRVNVADIMALVNYVLKRPVIDFEFRVGDVNYDDVITVTDIMEVVKICLEK